MIMVKTEDIPPLDLNIDRDHVFTIKPKKRDHVRELSEKTATHVPVMDKNILLLGKTGVGKSAAGNIILGGDRFHSERRASSVTAKSVVQQNIVNGGNVSVIDTPGFFDTNLSEEMLTTEIGRSIYLSSPGVHAFLIVLRADVRFTEQEMKVIQLIEQVWGKDATKYAIILFTHGDQLEGKTIEELIEDREPLCHLVKQCGQRYHVFNNKDKRNTVQVNELLNKIDKMVEQNEGGCYKNEMFADAERARREEEERLLKEEKEREHKEEERKQEDFGRVARETEERVRREYEESLRGGEDGARDKETGLSWFLHKYWKHLLCGALLVAGGTVVGAGVGVLYASAGASAGITIGLSAGASATANISVTAAGGVGALVGAGVAAMAAVCILPWLNSKDDKL